MMDCVLSGSLLVVFSLFCYAMCVFFEQINSLSLSLSLAKVDVIWFDTFVSDHQSLALLHVLRIN